MGRQSIYVDSLTAVPLKLYMEFENAGVSAKRRGQHTLRESRTMDGTLIPRLVMNQDNGESLRGQITSKLDIMRAAIAALQSLDQQTSAALQSLNQQKFGGQSVQDVYCDRE